MRRRFVPQACGPTWIRPPRASRAAAMATSWLAALGRRATSALAATSASSRMSAAASAAPLLPARWCRGHAATTLGTSSPPWPQLLGGRGHALGSAATRGIAGAPSLAALVPLCRHGEQSLVPICQPRCLLSSCHDTCIYVYARSQVGNAIPPAAQRHVATAGLLGWLQPRGPQSCCGTCQKVQRA